MFCSCNAMALGGCTCATGAGGERGAVGGDDRSWLGASRAAAEHRGPGRARRAGRRAHRLAGGGAMIRASLTTAGGRGQCPAPACELAARLAALFERDVEIVERLNDAQRRLRDANERLWSGLSPDAFGLIHDGAAAAGESQIAELIIDTLGAGGRASQTAVLEVLQRTHWMLCLHCILTLSRLVIRSRSVPQSLSLLILIIVRAACVR